MCSYELWINMRFKSNYIQATHLLRWKKELWKAWLCKVRGLALVYSPSKGGKLYMKSFCTTEWHYKASGTALRAWDTGREIRQTAPYCQILCSCLLKILQEKWVKFFLELLLYVWCNRGKNLTSCIQTMKRGWKSDLGCNPAHTEVSFA